jgi:hypothetical protein
MINWFSVADHLFARNFFRQIKQLKGEVIASSYKSLSMLLDGLVVEFKGLLFFGCFVLQKFSWLKASSFDDMLC